ERARQLGAPDAVINALASLGPESVGSIAEALEWDPWGRATGLAILFAQDGLTSELMHWENATVDEPDPGNLPTPPEGVIDPPLPTGDDPSLPTGGDEPVDHPSVDQQPVEGR